MGIGPSCPRGENALLQPTPQYDDIAGLECRICSSRSLPPAATASQLRPEAICAVQLSFVAFMASSFTRGISNTARAKAARACNRSQLLPAGRRLCHLLKWLALDAG